MMNIDSLKAGPLLALGSDIVEVERIRDLWQRQGDAFLAKVFTEEEQAYSRRMKDPAMHLAARFAAKEAVSKCFGTGIGEKVSWKSISVFNDENGRPELRLDEPTQRFLEEMGGSHVVLTLSHTKTMALAVAAIVGKKNGNQAETLT